VTTEVVDDLNGDVLVAPIYGQTGTLDEVDPNGAGLLRWS
jgi:hypothetical protein